MFWQTPDEIIRREVESVPVRKIILDQLEGGPKTGSELRESIRKDLAARSVRGARGRVRADMIYVTDPKLYFNTKHLESIGIITSKKVSQRRIYRLTPKAIHPVRRVIGATRPKILLTSIEKPEEQRQFANWLNRERIFRPKFVRVFVEEHFSRGSRRLETFMALEPRRRWEMTWHDLPLEIAGDSEGNVRGDLRATYDEIEKVILDDIDEFDLIVDLSRGPPLILLALTLLAFEYSLAAIHARKFEGEDTEVIHIFPWERWQ